ncbi:MAG: hypothetical protein ABIZ05_08185 [Pseudonocardiaceae bacterium]
MRSSSEPEERAQFTVAELLARYGEASPAPGRRHRRAAEGPGPTANAATAPVVPVIPPLFAERGPLGRIGLLDGPVTERLPRLDSPPVNPVPRLSNATLAEPRGNATDAAHPPECETPEYQESQTQESGSPLWDWAVMVGQVGIGVGGGGALWLICEWLWQWNAVVALVVALAMITGLVWVVRRVRRTEDLQTTVIAVLVGLFVTVSPAALLLVNR